MAQQNPGLQDAVSDYCMPAFLQHTAITLVYAEPNRERSEAHKMAEGHARNEAEVWLRHDTLVKCFCQVHVLRFDMLHTLLAHVVGSHLALPLLLELADYHRI